MKITRQISGWIFYDFANSAFATTVLAVIFNQYYAGVVAGGPEGIPVNILGWTVRVPGASMWSFMVAISMTLVAFTSPLMGAIADFSGWRKRFLFFYCYLGVIATIGLGWIGPGDVIIGGVIFILANFGFAGGNVFYNAFLVDITEDKYFGRISGLAWGLGYLGGGLCLLLNLVMLQKPQFLGFPEGYFTVGHCLMVCGLWWGLFAIPMFTWVKQSGQVKNSLPLTELVKTGWGRVFQTFREIRRYRELFKLLLAYLLFNDGIQTVILMASIFGSEVIKLQPAELIAFFILVQGTALVGSFFFGWLTAMIGNRRVLLLTLIGWIGVVVWAYCIGWLFNPKTDYYVIGIVTGIVMGGSQSAARALQASFTPLEKSTEFFGFWALSGKVASIFGPLIYGIAIIIAGGVQPGILVLGVFFLLGGGILLTIDEDKGKRLRNDGNIMAG